METIEIKDVIGVVLFSHTAENNNIEITVEEAVKKNVKLNRANLANANLANANLRGANLRGANLRGANLKGAELAGANLSDADLREANFSMANLYRTNLDDADLADADLTDADLYRANLTRANLSDADLYNTNLERVIIDMAYLVGAQNIPYIPLACPSEGAFIGWKKVDNEYLVKLQIPEDARRSSATTRKCRCDKAMVLDITSLDGEEHYNEVVNYNYTTTVYKVGEMVYPNSFDDYRWLECSTGIHFFVNKQDAINY